MTTLTTTKPVPNTTVDANALASNFTAIEGVVNGNIDNSNIVVGAAIAIAKLANYPSNGAQFLAGDGTWKAAGATVATTVAGLSTASDGKIGRLRVGSTPFDFVTVVYDATYGKWVSELKSASDEFQSALAVSATYSYTNAGIAEPYAIMVTAGLALQVRHYNSLKATVADGTMDLAVSCDTAQFTGTTASSGTIFGSTAVTPSTSYSQGNTGWLAAAAFLTSHDIVQVYGRVRKATGTGTFGVDGGTVYSRWVA